MIHDLHAQFAQSLVTTLLEYSRYRVLRLGIEEVISEVKSLQSGPGQVLRLPERLRALPDLMVVDQERADTVMLEVKFRRAINEESVRTLVASLGRTFAAWPEAIGIVVTGQPPIVGSQRYQDFLRVVRPGDVEGLGSRRSIQERWQALPTFGAVFARVHDVPGFHAEADRALAALQHWTVPAPSRPGEGREVG